MERSCSQERTDAAEELRVIIDKRGPSELVQQFANRGSSHRRKSAGMHIFDMVGYIARLSQWVGGGYFTCSNVFACLRGARGRGSAPCAREWRGGGRSIEEPGEQCNVVFA